MKSLMSRRTFAPILFLAAGLLVVGADNSALAQRKKDKEKEKIKEKKDKDKGGPKGPRERRGPRISAGRSMASRT